MSTNYSDNEQTTLKYKLNIAGLSPQVSADEKFGLNQLVTQGQDYDIYYRCGDKHLSVKAKTSPSVAYRGRGSLRYFAR